MAYFPDLAPYAYFGRHPAGVVHVGWLDAVHDFPKGEVAPALIEKLKRLASRPVALARGYHLCEICEKPAEARLDPIPNRIGVRPNEAWTRWATPRMSYGEIRIKRGDVTFAAPMCIAHYIEAHGYLPPADFLRAVEEEPNQPQEPTDGLTPGRGSV